MMSLRCALRCDRLCIGYKLPGKAFHVELQLFFLYKRVGFPDATMKGNLGRDRAADSVESAVHMHSSQW